MARIIFAIIFLLGTIFLGMMCAAFLSNNEQLGGMPGFIFPGAGALVTLVISILLFRRKKK